MTAVNQLINNGLQRLGRHDPAVCKPVVVVGPARSGTSMIAGVLHHLGMYLGQKAPPPVFEDIPLSQAFESGSDRECRKLIEGYVRQHGTFAWKRPNALHQLERVDRLFRKPRYIFVFKDIFSIARRNQISMFQDSLVGMKNALAQYQKVLDFLGEARPEALLVSYDKAVQYRAEFVDEVAAFCALRPEPAQVERAIGFIDPASEEYLEKSRINRTQGVLAGLGADGSLRGWARFAYHEGKAVVDIWVNDALVASPVADLSGESAGVARKDACAFLYRFPDGALRPGDIIRARVRGEIRDLDKSPLTVAAAQARG